MAIEMNITEKFELTNGITVLICSSYDQNIDVIGKQLYLISGTDIRQKLTISSERMLNQKMKSTQRALETSSTVKLSSEEAQSGSWKLVDMY